MCIRLCKYTAYTILLLRIEKFVYVVPETNQFPDIFSRVE